MALCTIPIGYSWFLVKMVYIESNRASYKLFWHKECQKSTRRNGVGGLVWVLD